MTKTLELPLLAPHDDAMQKCVYCPKLSRASCPVSNVEGNETVTPWGKMSMAWYTMRGDVPLDADHAESAWACSACFGCRERCDHKNDVAGVLAEARAEYFAAGVAPPVTKSVVAGFAAHADANRAGVDAIDVESRQAARTALLIGCSYVRHHPDVAKAVWSTVQALADGEVRAVRSCCGLPLLHAGDRSGPIKTAHQLVDEVRDADTIIVADAGCARALMVDYVTRTVTPPNVVPLVDWLYARLDKLPARVLGDRTFRYQDPCQLGRGLGRYDEPRAILARITGVSPSEMPRHREQAECSGGGGLLPLTRPETSRKIADERIDEHRQAGGGTLVTACGESLRRFRSRGEEAVDLLSLVAEALGVSGSG
jgi:Fe-S oxidoreductase